MAPIENNVLDPLNDEPPSLQPLSLFFDRLPFEIRQLIYLAVWQTTPDRQHIWFRNVDDTFAKSWYHAPCLADPNAADNRYDEFSQASRGSVAEAIWATRLKSEWCLHWACEESRPHWRANNRLFRVLNEQPYGNNDSLTAAGSIGEHWGAATETPFKHLLHVCKRMYLEARPSLYANTTFVFTDLVEADGFLTRYGNSERFPIRSLELAIRTTQFITELYFPAEEGPHPGFGQAYAQAQDAPTQQQPQPTSAEGEQDGPHYISMASNPWGRVCDHLVRMKNLAKLRIWFDTRDLRGWHTRVSEPRFFAKLSEVRAVKNKKNFVLSLPEIPDSAKGGPHHLSEEMLEAAPFTVERGPRPNNWRVHLMTSGLRGT